jgi:radical SAM-linked protein
MPKKFHFLVRFTKKDRARYLSHRELLNLIEQSLRRADIPLAFSEGFNPRPKISFPTALSLGISSDDEIISIQLSEWLKPEDILHKLNQQLIRGITVSNIEPLKHDTSSDFCVEYKITLPDELQFTEDMIKNWFKAPSQIVQRHIPGRDTRTINLKDYVRKIELKHGSIFLTINITNQGTARPEEVLTSLGIKGNLKDRSFSIHKVKTLIYIL